MSWLLWIAIGFFILVLWVWLRIRFGQQSPPGRTVVSPKAAKASSYPYIYVNNDGSVRELHPDEREYLETPFEPGASDRPYIKRRYSARDGWGDLDGFCKRSAIPSKIVVQEAPAENPNKPLNVDQFVEHVKNKGFEVTKNDDGTITFKPPSAT